MCPMNYHRPDTIEQALRLLRHARPLAGGTSLAAQRADLSAVVDLQALPLGDLIVGDLRILLGAGLKLQALVEAADRLPVALVQAVRLEAPVNIRNMATVAGTIVACDGRSPLVSAMLAMDASVRLEPGGAEMHLDKLLDGRPDAIRGKLITVVELGRGVRLAYQQVARAPKDLPIVCAALGLLAGRAEQPEYRLALGGHGQRPLRVPMAEEALARGDIDRAALAASAAYAAAGDKWATAEYRAHLAAVLTRRLAQEVGR
jgi:CO/xanthine dehydrogenase FAD-binding subunit